MKTYINPSREQWQPILQRPSKENEAFDRDVLAIMDAVESSGDSALREYNAKFDNYSGDLWAEVHPNDRLGADLTARQKDAIDVAWNNITRFHAAQAEKEVRIETMPGIMCWRRAVPIDRVGLYIPGGSAPLISTLLMLGIPARLACCGEIVICTPPGPNGSIHPALRYVAAKLAIEKVHLIGGAQAIAAMGVGTHTIPQVDKIFGPGNQYVTRAKQFIQMRGVAIDMPAGPSELMVYADNDADTAFVVADLLSQAEHGPDSQVVVVLESQRLIKSIEAEIEIQLRDLPRKEIAQKALSNSSIMVIEEIDGTVELINYYAPEHLILNCRKANEMLPKIRNAGSVFIGPYSAEAIGDYASGTNHTLPTSGFARMYSGVNLQSFMKSITFQEVTRKGFEKIGPVVAALAEMEQLEAHRRAITIRQKRIKTGVI